MKKIDPANIELGQRLRSFRKAKRLTIETVARAIDVAPSTYREWENGRAITGNPYTKIAYVLGVSVQQILGAKEDTRGEVIHKIMEIERMLNQLKTIL